MTQCPWTHLVDEPAARHLVAARIAPKAADEPAALLATLIEGLCPNGDFALITRCEEECAVTLCAFAHPADADQLALAVGAEETDRYPDWASQRCFTLDHSTAQAIADAIEASGAALGVPQHPVPADVLPAHP
jgi:hypothetical protein